MLVSQILKSKTPGPVHSVRPGDSLAEAARLLSAQRIGALVVVQPDGRLCGILSERDIVRELGRRGPACLADSVAEIMTADPVTCAPGDTADALLETMTAGRFRHLPVMEDGQMCGLVSIGDVVKARIDELAMEKSALEGMIMGH